MAAIANAPPAYQDAVKSPSGVYQPQQGYGAVPQGGYPAVPQGGYPAAGSYGSPPQGGFPQPPAGATFTHQYNVTMQQPVTHRVVIVGGCPACRVGALEDDFTCLGVLCAILFFPLGILCCLAMRQRRCAHCGAVFG